MCLAVPGEIKRIDNNIASVDIMGVSKDINIELVGDLQIGDYVLIHAGCAISKIDREEALKTIEIFRELGELDLNG
jgi:hydrogenase expression/formation protein HypC